MQPRAKTGRDFEVSLDTTYWVRKETKPKLIWEGDGKTIIDKIKNTGYDVMKFNLSPNSIIVKSDFHYKNNDNLTFEVKKYEIKEFNKWLMYSEPFFKIASKEQLSQITTDDYNKFVDEFYTKRQDIITEVLNKIVESNLGIRCIDGFIPQHKLEFKVKVVNGWSGYNRITIFCKIKGVGDNP
jgi:hypothetical protein